MIRSLWISATGLDAQQMQLDTISQNLANVSTNGYKRAHAQFEDLLYQNMRQSGSQETQATTTPVGLQLGTGVRPVGTTRLFSQGNLNKTENPMDLAINGGCDCVVCGSGSGVYRPELPLKAMANVCDKCWPHIAADLAAGEDEAEFEEAIPA
jgi:flagellar basal-body rod protein FlgB